MENLTVARENLATAGGKRLPRRSSDSALRPLLGFLGRVFESADQDANGKVNSLEFRQAFRTRAAVEEMRKLGFGSVDVAMLFRQLDRDGSTDLSLDELTDGFLKLKMAMRGMERTMNFIRKAFAEVDDNDSGSLDLEEFQRVFENASVMKQMGNLGIGSEDLRELFDSMEKDHMGQVRLEAVMDSLVRLRDPANLGPRGVKLLKRHFGKADVDGSGGLDREELLKAFTAPELDQELLRLKLEIPDWEMLFAELDLDGSGDLQWEELEVGMQAYWSE
jgi:Ca2+-binding EF-hand superfamily protein